jgi:RNA polymerase sigma-70 factor, ECF subfamily
VYRKAQSERSGARRAGSLAEAMSGAAAKDDGGSAPVRNSGGYEVAAIDFEDLYEQHFDFVWRSLRVLGVRYEVVDDAIQDVFCAAAKQLGRFEGRSSLRTWVFGIVQNTAFNYRRTHSRKLDRLEPLDEGLVSGEPTPHAHAEGKEAANLVSAFCSDLDESRRAIFVLALLEGVPATEIASSLGLPVNTIYSRIHALRQALRQRLEAREVEA